MIAKGRFSDRSVKALKHKKDRYEVTEPGRTSLTIRVAAPQAPLKLGNTCIGLCATARAA